MYKYVLLGLQLDDIVSIFLVISYSLSSKLIYFNHSQSIISYQSTLMSPISPKFNVTQVFSVLLGGRQTSESNNELMIQDYKKKSTYLTYMLLDIHFFIKYGISNSQLTYQQSPLEACVYLSEVTFNFFIHIHLHRW